MTYMVGGVSYVVGGLTLAEDAEVEFAQGTLPGEKKCFICLGTLTSYAFVIDLATAGISIDGSTTLNEIQGIDAADDAAYLQFQGGLWHTQDVVGGATEFDV